MDHDLVGTADICDLEPNGLQIVRSQLRPYGGNHRCSGVITTIRLDTGSHGLKQLLAEAGEGRIVVVDVGGRYFSVVGDRVGTLAHQNNWNGLIVNGHIRDSLPLRDIPISVWALGTCPQKGVADPGSERDIPLNFGAVQFRPGDYLYADEDGVITTSQKVSEIEF